MSIDGTYTGLKASIADFLNRADLTSVIPDFIVLAEGAMRRRLRTRRATGRSDATLSSQYIAVPSDFGGPRAIVLTGTSPKALLKYVEPSEFFELQDTTYTSVDQPKCYSVIGEELAFLPSPDASYTIEMTYWKGLAALTVSNTSNWMLTDNPDAYLYGSLLQSAPYLMDDDRIAMWGMLFTAIMDDIKIDDEQANYGGRLNIRAKSFG